MKLVAIKFFAGCIVCFTISGFAQTINYKDNLKKNITVFETAKTTSDFLKAATGFESLAIAEKKEWLPYYYSALCNVLVAFKKTNQDIDPLCDKAEGFSRIADSLSKNNSEIYVLKSMIAAARINVSKTTRGAKYGMMAAKFANEALSFNDANPRAHFVKAQAILNTPVAFGGGQKKAKPVFELAIEKAKIFKPESDLYPTWVIDEAQKELKKINSKSKN